MPRENQAGISARRRASSRQRLVAFRAAEEDGDFVEGDAGFADSAGNFHTFETFAGGGEEVEGRAGGGGFRIDGEDGFGDGRERGWGGVLFAGEVDGLIVAGDGESEDRRGLLRESGDEVAVGLGGEGDVEQEEGEIVEVGGAVEGFDSEFEDESEVGEVLGGAFLFEGVEEVREVGGGDGFDLFEAEFGEGGGDGGGESGSGGDGREVGNLAGFIGVGDDAGGEGFDGELAGGLEIAGGELGGGELGGELSEGEPLGGEEALTGEGAGVADEVIGGGAGGGEDEGCGVFRKESDGVGVECGGGMRVD